MARLKDKIVLITGSSGAIGKAIVEAVNAAGGVAVTSDLAGQGATHALNVASEMDWLQVIANLGRAYGRLDGLVNAAGIAALGNIEETDFATWRKIMSVNLDGTFLGCKHGLSLLNVQGGAIVNLSSIAGLIGGHNFAAYNASKGGVRLLTKSVALHGARLNPQVRCNSVHPAFLEGPMVDAMLESTNFPDAARARITREIPLGRLGTPAEVADMCIYLLSDEARFVTGAEFVIDGGMTAR
jgi:3(or 17)beta-hydroxysteroid dehydrogenase